MSLIWNHPKDICRITIHAVIHLAFWLKSCLMLDARPLLRPAALYNLQILMLQSSSVTIFKHSTKESRIIVFGRNGRVSSLNKLETLLNVPSIVISINRQYWIMVDSTIKGKLGLAMKSGSAGKICFGTVGHAEGSVSGLV